jgi:hypothetical protein
MSITRSAVLLAVVLVASGCYHARIETGLTPSAQVVEESFASGWIYGLVPPSTVEAGEQCPNGVAVVETQLSFVNQLVTAITFGIYTPMHIKVTCAAGGTSSLAAPAASVAVAHGASAEEISAAFMHAADLAVATEQAVAVQFE